MGIAMRRMSRRMVPVLSGMSRVRRDSSDRVIRKLTVIYTRATMVPTVTPVIAPAAAISGGRFSLLMSHQARGRPMASLQAASMI